MSVFVIGFALGVLATLFFKIGSDTGAYTRGLITGRLTASGIETEGQDGATRLGAKHESPTLEEGDAQT